MGALSLSLTFECHHLRVFGTPERPEWSAKDVCRVLDIHNSRRALAEIIPANEKGVRIADTLGGPQEVATVTEGGLFRLITRSRKPSALRFQAWLFNDVLPCIRKHGCYPAPAMPAAESLAVIDFDDPQQLRRLCEGLALRRLADSALIDEQQTTIARLEPKAEVFDLCMASEDLLTVQVIAKILNRPGRPLGELRLFRCLREIGVLQESNQPFQRFIDDGYFAIRENVWKDRDGKPHVYAQTLVTQKGLDYVRRRLDAESGQRSLLPVKAVRPTTRELS